MIYLCALLAVATLEDGLTAAEIVHRSAIAQNIRARGSRPYARLATFHEDGHTWTSLVVVKPPDKLLIRDSYPWLSYTVYRGFDGVRAWTSSNLGGGGLANPDSARLIISTMAWYTDADMIPGRWPIDFKRLPDQTIDGKSYFTIEEHPKDGNTSTVWIDKADYSSRAVSSRSDRFFKCVKRQSIGSICLREEIVSGGQVVGTVDIEPVAMQIDDIQFEMPEMLADSTTSWFLDRYAKALGWEDTASAFSGQMQQISEITPPPGTSQVQVQTAPPLTMQWRLQTTRPQAFTVTQSYSGRVVWRLTFDGTQGTVERMGNKLPATYASAIMGMAYNKCELDVNSCSVRVTRLANVGINGRAYYALGITSIKTPYLWYTLLLDQSTYLPYALWLRDQIVYLEDYAPSPRGEAVPATWTFETTVNTFKVSGVREVPMAPI